MEKKGEKILWRKKIGRKRKHFSNQTEKMIGLINQSNERKEFETNFLFCSDLLCWKKSTDWLDWLIEWMKWMVDWIVDLFTKKTRVGAITEIPSSSKWKTWWHFFVCFIRFIWSDLKQHSKKKTRRFFFAILTLSPNWKLRILSEKEKKVRKKNPTNSIGLDDDQKTTTETTN